VTSRKCEARVFTSADIAAIGTFSVMRRHDTRLYADSAPTRFRAFLISWASPRTFEIENWTPFFVGRFRPCSSSYHRRMSNDLRFPWWTTETRSKLFPESEISPTTVQRRAIVNLPSPATTDLLAWIYPPRILRPLQRTSSLAYRAVRSRDEQLRTSATAGDQIA